MEGRDKTAIGKILQHRITSVTPCTAGQRQLQFQPPRPSAVLAGGNVTASPLKGTPETREQPPLRRYVQRGGGTVYVDPLWL